MRGLYVTRDRGGGNDEGYLARNRSGGNERDTSLVIVVEEMREIPHSLS